MTPSGRRLKLPSEESRPEPQVVGIRGDCFLDFGPLQTWEGSQGRATG